ncbi:erwinia induced protein 2 [Musa troglodytarum]|uniref:Endoplasmic reticulum transmembrane protein n=1 Tax=Musa troglodytarum TaxID=320322 RepID=A0A9E7KRT9_9LILI|nr:erwinia induced protein 2 [Musa troglodytarum]URE24981.1 erwinia induced protein 2 [Musa troglodytarum]
MGLQWVILAGVVAVEAAVAVLLTLPAPRLVKSRIVALASLILQPGASIVPFAAFQFLDLRWKNEHRLMCTSEICTTEERTRYEKSIFKAQRNVILCVSACLLYWCIFRICKYHKEIRELEEVEKHLKDQ